MTTQPDIIHHLERIADALERISPPSGSLSLERAEAFVWHAAPKMLEMVAMVDAVPLDALKGIESQKNILLDNSIRFAKGFTANNALLWGARGTGKSSLVKAVHRAVNDKIANSLALVEISREDISSMANLLAILKQSSRRVLLFCDDLSFEHADENYKSLKTLLDGGIAGRPENVLFYATSNRRHLMARHMIENESSTAIHPGEVIEEKISLSDRFGLWIGFHNLDQNTFFDIIEGYISIFNLDIAPDKWRPEALEWMATRGSRTGRVAWQFIQDLAGRLERHL